jgi:glycine/D-amino acid oxidase-like deaminating enzyme
MSNSPWLEQLKLTRKINPLTQDQTADILIIGGGIAGICTAYFLLKNTNLKIGLVEATRIAHGATGHNAGQVVGYFEKPFTEIVSEYGLEKALAGQETFKTAWDLLDEMFVRENLDVPYSKLTGYAGMDNWSQIIHFLDKKLVRDKNGHHSNSALISQQALEKFSLPKKYLGYFQVVDQTQIWKVLETKNQDYIAAFGVRKGVLNSSQFCEEVTDKLLFEYQSRFIIWEKSPIDKLILEKETAFAITKNATITANKVVLCTNGFENIKIENKLGQDIDGIFHENVIGRIGYMAGYLEPKKLNPIATSFIKGELQNSSAVEADPYFYLTRRNYFYKKNEYSLVCVGGPEMELADRNQYDTKHKPNKQHFADIANFLTTDFKYSHKKPQFDFKWHGLMGYTKNGLRLIGPEPRNKILLYNLGCNGVGILPSIYGGWKIAEFINSKVTKSSIFDPN